MSDWQNRIVGYGEEDPEQLLANPRNHRIHPRRQQDALKGSLDTLGYIQTVIVNRTTAHIVDGHLRVVMAMREGQKSIPVTYVELTPEEEAQALLSLDPIAAMAANDRDKVDELLRMVNTDNADVMRLISLVGGDIDVLGVGDVVGKDEGRSGSSPWDRVVASDRVRCLIGDIEFGIEKDKYVLFLDLLKKYNLSTTREAAQTWMEVSITS